MWQTTASTETVDPARPICLDYENRPVDHNRSWIDQIDMGGSIHSAQLRLSSAACCWDASRPRSRLRSNQRCASNLFATKQKCDQQLCGFDVCLLVHASLYPDSFYAAAVVASYVNPPSIA
ncbi:hypothetical protein [Novipirellula caenicola]|uniref:hypothetical protein n=1 Tax=Novipirellula caenicola TaxID=1536901 RepID=UPI0031EDEFA1